MQADLKKGSTNLKLSMVNSYNTTDWFIVSDDKDEQIGSILLNITSLEVDSKSPDKRGLLSEAEEDEDIDENQEQSIDYRDLEISRSVNPQNHRKGNLDNGYLQRNNMA